MQCLPAVFRSRRAARAVLLAAAGLWSACSDVPDTPTGPDLDASRAVVAPVQEAALGRAIQAQERNAARLMAIPGVVGHAVGVRDGEPVVLVYTRDAGVGGIPERLEGIATRTVASGMVVAWTDETGTFRPAPLGVSIGHPDITAGTLGFKVVDGAGNSFILSNNHVMANSNQAIVGDHILQPGPVDGGTDPADRIGDLAAFVPIDFSGADNVVDAAIASVLSTDVLSATPLDEGYGQPSSTTVPAFVGMAVQKYGRTTGHTRGIVDAINGTFDICYEPLGPFCLTAARFVNQIVITPGTFSAGGDSGSGIVTDDANRNPVALLFAGSTSFTIANPIDRVLAAFDVTVDDGGGEPPPDLTDIGIAGVSAPASVTGGDLVPVSITVSNGGNQDVTTSFDVTLRDVTDAVVIGSQTVPGLSAGGNAVIDFSWSTEGASFAPHTLVATHDFPDDRPLNDSASVSVAVTDPSAPSGVHVADLDVVTSDDGSSWSATVEVAIHDAAHGLVNGATVVGEWSPSGLASDTCTTGELGGTGTCIFLFPTISTGTPSVTFTVTSVTMTGETYQPGENHDPDGDSDGTAITAENPASANTAPTATGESYEATVGQPLTVPAPGVLANDSDLDGDALTAVLDAGPSLASAFALNADGSFSYTPASAGADSFTYHAFDGVLGSNVVTVTIAVSEPAPEGVTVSGITPNSASTNSAVAVEISGSGFEAGAAVAFEGGGGPTPQVSNVVVVDGSTIAATVTIKSGGPPRNRQWNVRVTNPDGSSGVLNGGFTVTP